MKQKFLFRLLFILTVTVLINDGGTHILPMQQGTFQTPGGIVYYGIDGDEASDEHPSVSSACAGMKTYVRNNESDTILVDFSDSSNNYTLTIHGIGGVKSSRVPVVIIDEDGNAETYNLVPEGEYELESKIYYRNDQGERSLWVIGWNSSEKKRKYKGEDTFYTSVWFSTTGEGGVNERNPDAYIFWIDANIDNNAMLALPNNNFVDSAFTDVNF